MSNGSIIQPKTHGVVRHFPGYASPFVQQVPTNQGIEITYSFGTSKLEHLAGLMAIHNPPEEYENDTEIWAEGVVAQALAILDACQRSEQRRAEES